MIPCYAFSFAIVPTFIWRFFFFEANFESTSTVRVLRFLLVGDSIVMRNFLSDDCFRMCVPLAWSSFTSSMFLLSFDSMYSPIYPELSALDFIYLCSVRSDNNSDSPPEDRCLLLISYALRLCCFKGLILIKSIESLEAWVFKAKFDYRSETVIVF